MRGERTGPTPPLATARRRAASAAVPVAALLVAGLSPPAAARAEETLSGPVAAEVIRVVDGDTLAVRAHIWLGQEVVIRVRLDGVDAPELRAACREERRLAEAAKAFLEAELADRRVVLRRIRHGKFAGRVLARVATADGRSLAGMLLERGLARRYAGGRRAKWCP